jgi:hypothetical protein
LSKSGATEIKTPGTREIGRFVVNDDVFGWGAGKRMRKMFARK